MEFGLGFSTSGFKVSKGHSMSNEQMGHTKCFVFQWNLAYLQISLKN